MDGNEDMNMTLGDMTFDHLDIMGLAYFTNQVSSTVTYSHRKTNTGIMIR